MTVRQPWASTKRASSAIPIGCEVTDPNHGPFQWGIAQMMVGHYGHR